MEQNQLTKKLRNKIDDICEQGDLFIIDAYDYAQAILKYNDALELVPDPKEEHEVTTWIYTAIGDAYYLDDEFTMAKEYFDLAYKLPKGENAFVNLRIGQCYHKDNDLDLAKQYLIKAYQLGGEQTFEEYDDTFELISDLI